MTSIAVKVSDALRAVSITKKVSTIDVASMVATISHALRARLRAQSQSGHVADEVQPIDSALPSEAIAA